MIIGRKACYKQIVRTDAHKKNKNFKEEEKMRINNNLMAMNTHRQLGITTDSGAKATEKLSSGFRINRAGDDAAGLAISEKMRGQIRGLNQASRNAQDGISLIQTAEGALNETHAILQRMRELAVQSSTDTNTEVDREEIQKEINQLAEEITRIADTTEFNTQNLLGGKFEGIFHIGANEGQNITLAINDMSSQALRVAGDGEGKANYEIEGTDATLTGTTNFNNLAINAGENKTSVVKIDNITIGTDIANYGLSNEKGEIVAISADGKTYKLLTEATSKKDLAGATVSAVTGASIVFTDAVISGKVTFKGTEATDSTITDIKATASIDVKGLETGTYEVITGEDAAGILDITLGSTTDLTHALKNADGDVVAVSKDGENWYSIEDAGDLTAENPIAAITAETIMTSATKIGAGEKIEIKAEGGINVSTQETADKAITIINDAIETVSAERSKLGAMQNRLEHTIKNLDTSAENLQASESRIRDVDMAQEMMEFTKQNILQQASTAMLAQANMAPQSVLQLLR